MRIEEAKTFLKSFGNSKASLFVQKMMKNNYSDAIMNHHPDKEMLDEPEIKEKCVNLVDEIQTNIENIKNKPEELFPLFHKLSRNNPTSNDIWFDEFRVAYQNYKHKRKLTNRLAQLKPFLQGESYCDIGCGGGDLVKFIKDNYTSFSVFAGIDVLDWRTESVKEEMNFQMLDFTQPNTKSSFKYDTLTCLAVLHHVGSTNKEISVFLENIKSAFNKNGRLIIEEDVILPFSQIEENASYRIQLANL